MLNTLNTRLDAEAIAFMLQHGEAKVVLTDREYADVMAKALAMCGTHRPFVIEVEDATAPEGMRLGEVSYEGSSRRRPGLRLAVAGRRVGRDRAQLHLGHDRQPQGRGHAPPRRLPQCGEQRDQLAAAAPRDLPVDAADVPLQRLVLPVDDGADRGHQRIACAGSTGADLRARARAPHHHLCGAPIVYGMLINTPEALRAGIEHKLHGQIAGAAPPRR